MDYSVMVLSVCIYVEGHVKEKVDRYGLEQAIGYSYPHIRKVFREYMRIPLSRYILLRRLSYAAFDLSHSDKKLLDIAVDYSFERYDTFTRAFRRETGLLPCDFRRMRARAGRRLIASGVYAPAILDVPSPIQEKTEVVMNQKQKDGGILLGVPKVEYRQEECTPFPSCLKACLNYMGQDIDYTFLMAASGAAFRLRWNKRFWDGGNVDVGYIYEDGTEAYQRSFQAAGRDYRFLKREESDKQGFKDFIKAEIDEGRPLIALGVIGPPEACIITGYQDDGDTLVGWNFFQHRPEYNKDVRFHECGYFICSNWWENECSSLLMSIGETQNALVSDKQILQNALALVDREPITWEGSNNEITCGQEAYDTWAKWTEDDNEFNDSITLPLLCERHMCQIDAQTMVAEGRWYAGKYMEMVAKRHPEAEGLCKKAAKSFYQASEAAFKRMNDVIEDREQKEDRIRRYAKPEIRRKIVGLIREAAGYEAKAMELVSEIVEQLD